MIGNRIAQLRRELNLTQKELAARLNVTPSAISNYENAHSQPSAEFLGQISACLHVSCDYILGLTQDRRPLHDTPSYTRDGEETQVFAELSRAPAAKRVIILRVISTLLAEL